MKKILLFIFIAVFTATHLPAQNKYACFENGDNKNLQLSVYFTKDKAVMVKYKGQKKAIPLVYTDTKQTANEGGDPAFFWTETYTVRAGKRITGTYVFTNGGAYELQLAYINPVNNKKTNFTIVKALAGENFSPYRNSPCF